MLVRIRCCDVCALLLPACGEKVGMRGPLRWARNCGAQNRGEAPSPSSLRSSTSPRTRGEVKKQIRSRDAPARPSFATLFPSKPFQVPPQEGRRSAERRSSPGRISGCGRAPRERMLPLARASGARALRRSTAALATPIKAMAQPRPCFLRLANAGRYPPCAVPVQRGTPQASHSAGRNDAQAAREQGYEPCPREPHSLRQSAVTGDAPS